MPTATLLVEGSDDQHVIWGLLARHSFPEVFSVEEKGGVENLLKVLPVQLKGSEIEAVGVVLDADLNLTARWNSLRSLLQKAGYVTCPAAPVGGGTILKEDGLPRFGAWIMPDNKLPGMLEDFVAYLVPAEDALWTRGCKAVADIPEDERKFILNHVTKANIHTWLSWQEDPGTPMGLAITKKYLDASAPAVAPFLKWLEDVFVTG